MVSLNKEGLYITILVCYWSIKMVPKPGFKLVFTRFFRRLSFKSSMALQCTRLKYTEKRMYFLLPPSQDKC